MIDKLRYWLLRGFIFLMPVSLLACATPAKAPERIMVPMPVPCKIEQVEKSTLPVAAEDASIFERAKVAAARIFTLQAENERLRAANNSPCTEPKP